VRTFSAVLATIGRQSPLTSQYRFLLEDEKLSRNGTPKTALADPSKLSSWHDQDIVRVVIETLSGETYRLIGIKGPAAGRKCIKKGQQAMSKK